MIKVENIIKNFEQLKVLKDVSFEVNKGEVVSIVGKSGAGKTTLMQIMGTLMTQDSGKIWIDNVDIGTLSSNKLSDFRNNRIGFVFQFHHLLPEFNAIENVMLPALIAGDDNKVAQKKAMNLLTMLDIAKRADHKPAQMSGGEQQRVAVARAIINSPAVLFADEPSGNLDSHNKKELHDLFFRLRSELGQTIVLVTHDDELAKQSDRIIELVDGQILNNER
ncbi:MAG: ABC transporter ATP-binding protein [Bacteroidetes bacterium]|nr:ABC transporter ATP-binding protein [Bacteroidota bacterium]